MGYLIPDQFSIADSIGPLPESPFFLLLLVPSLLGLEDIIEKDAYTVIRMQFEVMLIIFILNADVIPSSAMLDIVCLKAGPKSLAMLIFQAICFFLFLLVQLIQVVLEGIFSLMLIEKSPSGVGHEVIGHAVHLAVGV